MRGPEDKDKEKIEEEEKARKIERLNKYQEQKMDKNIEKLNQGQLHLSERERYSEGQGDKERE